MPRPQIVLDPELLKTFVTLVRVDGSVTRASQLLDINEASVSKRIKPLHEGHPPALPRPWLVKQGKTFLLTDEGRRLLPAAEEQLKRWDHFVAFAMAGRLNQLAVGCGREAVNGLVLDALRLWRVKHADHALRISTPRGEARIVGVATGLLDLALVTHDEAQIDRIARRPLLVDRLTDDPLVLVCGVKARWARDFLMLPDSGVKAPHLAAFPLILPEAGAGLREQLDRNLFEAGVLDRLTVAMEVGGWQAILTYAAEGLGIGLVPRSLADRQSKGLIAKPLASPLAPANELRLICRPLGATSEPDLSDAGAAFRRCLLDLAAKGRE